MRSLIIFTAAQKQQGPGKLTVTALIEQEAANYNITIKQQ